MGRINWEAADTEAVWIGEAREPGPTVGIFGGVHGDERAGVEVINGLRSELSFECGRIILAQGNPRAIELWQRALQANLNRSFRELTEDEAAQDPHDLPYEVSRAQELLPYLDRCRALLDLHEHHQASGKPFIICEPNAFLTARAIGAPVISFGWSESEPGGTDGYMYANNKEGICYELGYHKKTSPNVRRGRAAVARFLSAQGLIEEQFTPLFKRPTFVQTLYAHIRREEDFRLGRDFASFEALKAGELVAQDGTNRVIAEEGDVIIFPQQNPDIDTEAFNIGRLVEV